MIVRDVGGRVAPDEYNPNQHLVVVAFDPGVTTGWSVISYPLDKIASKGVGRSLPGCEWQHGEIRRFVQTQEEIENTDSDHVDRILDKGRELWSDFVDEDRDDVFVFVMESFNLRMMSMDPELLAPVRVLAVWKDRMRGTEIPCFYQTPSDAKTVVTNGRLQSWGMYDKHSGEHARDADRHNILFTRKLMGPQREALRNRLGLGAVRKSA